MWERLNKGLENINLMPGRKLCVVVNQPLSCSFVQKVPLLDAWSSSVTGQPDRRDRR